MTAIEWMQQKIDAMTEPELIASWAKEFAPMMWDMQDAALADFHATMTTAQNDETVDKSDMMGVVVPESDPVMLPKGILVGALIEATRLELLLRHKGQAH